MAASFPAASYVQSRRVLPHSSPSCASEVFTGSKLQSLSSFATKVPNLKVEFPRKVNEGIQPRSWSSKRTRSMQIPNVIDLFGDSVKDGYQWLPLYDRLRRERVLFLTNKIDIGVSNRFVAIMFYLDTTNADRMVIYIHSSGGDLAPSMAIYDTMKSIYCPVGTHCMGYAYDMAAFLLAGGEPDDRSSMPHSRIALQSPAGAARGQADEVQSESVKLLQIRNDLYKELAINTKQPVEKIYKDLNWMKFFSAQEALEYGIIDRIAKRPSVKKDAGKRKQEQDLSDKE